VFDGDGLAEPVVPRSADAAIGENRRSPVAADVLPSASGRPRRLSS